MKKKILIVISLTILTFWILTLIIPVKMGQIVYGFGLKTEATIYGLKAQAVDIGEMQMSIHVNDLKERPTILMLHGFSSDKNIWSRFAQHFTNDYNVIIPDMAGHGETGFSNEWSYTVSAQVNRLVSLLEKLNINKVHVIGNSMGGFFSAYFAKTFPEKILTVALVDPAGVIAPKASDMDKMLAKGRNPFQVNSLKEFEELYSMTMNAPPYVPGYVLQAVFEMYKGRRAQLTQIFSDFHDKDLLDSSLDEIRAPTLLLWGEKDRLIHVSSINVWKSGIKNIKVKTWPNIGHMPMIEIPAESAAVYKEFLDENIASNE
jgi:abhydrolase domain-containing protein 6